jgi:GNAT superfamily N-acetyltransferase
MSEAAEPVVIDRANLDDLDGIVALLTLLTERHLSFHEAFVPIGDWRGGLRRHLAERIGSSEHLIMVARAARRPVGLITATIRLSVVFGASTRGLLENLVVLEGWRRRGIGRRLVSAAAMWCETHGAEALEMAVAVRNEEALAFWRAVGFEPVLTWLYGPVREGNNRE